MVLECRGDVEAKNIHFRVISLYIIYTYIISIKAIELMRTPMGEYRQRSIQGLSLGILRRRGQISKRYWERMTSEVGLWLGQKPE